MPASDPEQARCDINHWNATRHGWNSFQTSNRKIAQRIARTAAPEKTTPGKPAADGEK